MSTTSPKHATPAARRRRRTLVAWLAFGVFGIAMGAVWATGFASIGGTTGSHAVSPVVAPTDPSAQPPELAGLVAPGTPLTVAWADRWGSVAATNFFTVDLSGQPANQTFNIAFLLTSTTTPTGWASLQLKLENKDIPTGACTAGDFDGSNRPEVMAFDHRDAGVYWNNLPGNAVYCIGVAAADGQQTDGTFLRAAQDAAPTVYPSFIATVDRAT